MASDAVLSSSQIQPEQVVATPLRLPRVWPAVVMVGLFWAYSFVAGRIELPTFVRFISSMAVAALLTLGFSIWWLLSRRRPLRERLLGLGAAIVLGIATAPFCHHSLLPFVFIFSAPAAIITAWTIWLLIARRMSVRTRLFGLFIVLLLTWAVFPLIRLDGISGEQVADFHWRWTPTAEDLYNAERAGRQNEPIAALSETAHVEPSDWPGFRGPDRDAVVRGLKIATDWGTNPPKQLWRQRVGPGWSSLAVVGDRLFTQEQRGPSEAVVCLDTGKGREVWAHEDAVRFEEVVAGAGPRATPTFADGRIYALGATGILNCLDAATGERKWFHDIVAESDAKVPQWGFCSSPLVIQGVVLVFAGGENDRHLLAYHAVSGSPAWTARAGRNSFSSPHRAVLGGEEQILFWGDHGLNAINPASGEILWEHSITAPGAPRSLQPHVAGPAQVLISSETDLGTALLDVKKDGNAWSATRRWTSRRLQPSFNDYVLHDGSIYGFDGKIFCCIDAGTGERRWRAGRYGHGQVLLLADQSLLLVLAESGEVVLLAASPDEHKELGRFQAIKGKTWNHPAIAHGRLYVRNGEEIACYELKPGEAR